jgi:HlyD family secretion protein
VKRIMPLGSSVGRDTVYTVVIAPDSWDDRLRWNMTASVRISPQQ